MHTKMDLENRLEHHAVDFGGIDDPERHVTIIPQENKERLTEEEQRDYHKHRSEFLLFLAETGKDLSRNAGYSPYTVSVLGERCAKLDRWVWDRVGFYKMPPSEREARAYMEEVAERDIPDFMKSRILESLRVYSKWLQYRYDKDEWELCYSFQSSRIDSPRDYLTKKERQKVRNGALNKPMPDGEDTWKFTTLIWTALDAGLRPVEVRNARTSWVDVQNGVLRIPKEESYGSVRGWLTSIRKDTADFLEWWLEERARKEEYDDTDRLWLTEQGNKYSWRELDRLLWDICEDMEIDHETREMNFYSIRHSTRLLMEDEKGLRVTKPQLRDRDIETTQLHEKVPAEDRRKALERMG